MTPEAIQDVAAEDKEEATTTTTGSEEVTQETPLESTIKAASPPPSQLIDNYLEELERYHLHERLANRLAQLFASNKLSMSDLDNRAIDALKEYGNIDGVLSILDEFEAATLEHVNNKSAYLCGLMKTHRQKEKALKSKSVSMDSSTKGGESTTLSSLSGLPGAPNGNAPGPDEANLKAILDRTGYTLDVTSGQRKYGGPPPNWEGPMPGPGCEIFVGKIPKEIFEDELIPLFEGCGTIWDLRLMIDPVNGYNRGFAFITYCNKDDAMTAQSQMDGYEVRKGKQLKVNVSVPNLRLFVGNIPKSKSREEILGEFSKLTGGLHDVIVYSSPDDRKKNRGFCFLEYDSHKSASLAKRKLSTGRVKVWNCDILVDWADPQEEPDQETMSKVKVLYVRNLLSEVTEEELKTLFEKYGTIERVKKIKDYAFVHFGDRDQAVTAMNQLHEHEVRGVKISVSLAKPPSDRKKKEEILRQRERRVQIFMQQRAMVSVGHVPIGVLPPGHPATLGVIPAAGPPPPPHVLPNTAQPSSNSGPSSSGHGGRGKGNRTHGNGGGSGQQAGYGSVPGSSQTVNAYRTNVHNPYATTPTNPTGPWAFPTDLFGYPTYAPGPGTTTNWTGAQPAFGYPANDPRTMGHPAQQAPPHTYNPRHGHTGGGSRGNRQERLWTPNGNAGGGGASGGGLSNGPDVNKSSKTFTNRNRNNNRSDQTSKSGGVQDTGR